MYANKGRKARILIIDDEEDVCVYLKSMLERTGKFEVMASTSASEGIDLAKSMHPDLVILDIIMPETDGTTVAQQLAENDITKNILIVFSSVLADEHDVEQNDGMIGNYPFIAKLTPKEKFLERIDSVLHANCV